MPDRQPPLDLSYEFSVVSLQRDDWDSPWQNRHAFLWELSNVCPTFFLAPPFYIVDLIERHRRPTKMRSGLHTIKPDLLAYVPPRWLPYNHRFPRLDSQISRWRSKLVQKAVTEKGFERPILFLWHPSFAGQIGQFNEKLVVYYKYDNYAGYLSDNKSKPGTKVDTEKQLLERADLVFVTSQGLFEMHREYADKMYLVPNGVDYELFSKAVESDHALPTDLATIPGPRIGYVGVINEKVDFRLLTALCRARPEWSIVLIGPDRTRNPEHITHLTELKSQPNSHFLGQKPGREVPNYLRGLDACMMCYLVNDWTYYGYPLKMHEYLAAGKPTIAAGLPAVYEFRHVVSIAEGIEEWLSAIENGLSGDDGVTKEQRQAVARANSWEERVKMALRRISERLGRERHGAA